VVLDLFAEGIRQPSNSPPFDSPVPAGAIRVPGSVTLGLMVTRVKAKFIEPMLLLRTDALPPDGTRWQYELKFDGYRAISFKTGGTVHLRSRNDNDSVFATPLTALSSRPQPAPPLHERLILCMVPNRMSRAGQCAIWLSSVV
jgi:hypothetical protein